MKKLTKLILVLALSTGLVACSDSDDLVNEENTQTEMIDQTQDEEPIIDEEDDHDDEDDHDHDHAASFEKMYEYSLDAATYELKFSGHQEDIDIGLIEITDQVTDPEHFALHIMEEDEMANLVSGETIQAESGAKYDLNLKGEDTFVLEIPTAGNWCIAFSEDPANMGYSLSLDGDVINPVQEYEAAVHEH